MKCYIFDVHITLVFLADTRYEDGVLFYSHDLVQVRPLHLICSEVILAVKREARINTSNNVPLNCWTDLFSLFTMKESRINLKRLKEVSYLKSCQLVELRIATITLEEHPPNKYIE